MSISGTPLGSKWTVLLIAAVGAFLYPLDNSMLYVAVPRIAIVLEADPGLVTWAPIASLVANTAFFIPFGRLSDVWGRKRLYLIGLAAALISAVFSGLAQNVYQLIGLRLIQGFGAALIVSNSWALISEAFPSQERGKALGIHTFATFLGLALGPVIGGVLVASLGWRSIFFALVPFYLLSLALALAKLRQPVQVGRARSYDFSGALSFIAGLVLFLMGLTFGRTMGWASPQVITLFALGGGLLGLFGYIETRVAREPMMDLRVFGRNKQFTYGNLATLLHYISAHQGVSTLIAFYVQWVLKQSASWAGVILLAKFLTMALFSPASGWLSDRVHPRWLCTLGMGFILSSLLLMGNMGPEAGLLDVFLRLSLLGVGVGLFASPNIKLVMTALPQEQLGIASGTLGTSRSLGGTLGLVIVGSMLAGGTATPDIGGRILLAFLVLSAFSFLGVLVSNLRGKEA
jgi:EmrB/QacA subfamily drug resistance transporter